jgi:hypothetical protein
MSIAAIKDKSSPWNVIPLDEVLRTEFSGDRDINGFIDSWLGIKNVSNNSQKVLVIDNMKGEISSEGICLLVEMLSEYNFYRKKKIAVVLAEENSYSARFFDVIAQNWGLNIKHFTAETEAVKWLSFQ